MRKSLKRQKEKRWVKLMDLAGRTVDGIDHPIDKEILPVVVGLWALGVKTEASCEGHMDWGHCYPWISIEAQAPKTWGEWDEWRKDERKRKIHLKKSLIECRKVMTLLELFQKTRKTPYKYRLILNDVNEYWGRGFILSHGAPLEPKNKRLLKRYQSEMKAFGVFLKDRFFHSV